MRQQLAAAATEVEHARAGGHQLRDQLELSPFAHGVIPTLASAGCPPAFADRRSA